MTDFRALCVKVLAYNEGQGSYNFSHLNDYDRDNAAFDAWQEIKAELKSALAKPEPEGPTVMQIIELADEIEAVGLGQVDLVRAALARWGHLAPQPPDNGEVADEVRYLVYELRDQADDLDPSLELFGLIHNAADLLQSLSPPQPVPVSERLPGPKDCDEEGRCWWWQPSHPEGGYLEGWMLRPRFWGVGHYDLDDRLTHTHWLPAHALPLPTAND